MSTPHGERQRTLRTLLAERRMTTQSAVAAALRDAGFAATQSGVSRDLRELGARKVAGRYRVGPNGQPGVAGVAAVAGLLESFVPAGPNILVVRTVAGGAQRAGHALDSAGWPEIAGTVAGDDTVFVASGSAGAQTRLLERLRAALAEGDAR